jgi:phage major head subunit gpT-like protein
MMSFKDEESKPLGVTPTLLVVPPTLESAARAILLNERDAQGATNPWYKTAELLVVPYL